jgi:hypothetical protein
MAKVLKQQCKSEWCAGLLSRPVGLGDDNNINNVNANNNFNNNGCARGIAHSNMGSGHFSL